MYKTLKIHLYTRFDQNSGHKPDWTFTVVLPQKIKPFKMLLNMLHMVLKFNMLQK